MNTIVDVDCKQDDNVGGKNDDNYFDTLFKNPKPTAEYNAIINAIHKNLEGFRYEYYPMLHEILTKNIYKKTKTKELLKVITFHTFTIESFEYLMFTMNNNKLTFHPYGNYIKNNDVWMHSEKKNRTKLRTKNI